MKTTPIIAAALAAAFALPALAAERGLMLKDPYCGCCDAWSAHMQRAGIALTTRIEPAMQQQKDRLGVPSPLRSCHTAQIGGYVFEGHVPADLVKKVLREKPAIAGLAVPGMPLGSPGMESTTKHPYHVVAFDRHGKTSVYAQR